MVISNTSTSIIHDPFGMNILAKLFIYFSRAGNKCFLTL
jgi:hypothetical protein